MEFTGSFLFAVVVKNSVGVCCMIKAIPAWQQGLDISSADVQMASIVQINPLGLKAYMA